MKGKSVHAIYSMKWSALSPYYDEMYKLDKKKKKVYSIFN